MQWEYCVEDASDSDLEETLQSFGEDGWELVTANTERTIDGSLLWALIFKRPRKPVPDQFRTVFEQIAEALVLHGNEPRTTKWILNQTGLKHSQLSQVLHRTHKDSFVSSTIPGYRRRRQWRLNEIVAADLRLAIGVTEP